MPSLSATSESDGLQDRVVSRWSLVQDDARYLLVTAAALAAVVVALTGVPAWIAALCAAPAWISEFVPVARSIVGDRSAPSVTRNQAAGVLLGVVPAVIYVTSGDPGTWGLIAVSIVALLPVGEPLLSKLLKGQPLGCAHLPGIRAVDRVSIPMRYVMGVDLLAIGIAIAVSATDSNVVPALSAAVLALVLMLLCLGDAIKRFLQSGEVREGIAQAIADYEPKFVLYNTAPSGSEYQVAMWLPYLERIGERFIVVLRSWSSYSEISAMTTAPVVVRPKIRDLNDVAVPSVVAAFYVNNGANNSHFVRYADITHIQLLHGDSDKPASYSPVTAMFNKIFVAGQAAIDRYADNGVEIPEDKFVIVGRPQVEAVDPRTEDNIPVRSVLYAPTWEGYQSETNYTSLDRGPAIVQGLLDRGLRVVFRPHPFSYRNDEYVEHIEAIHDLLEADERRHERGHVWGERAEQKLTLFECFNSVDALISDVSSVIPDFMYSTKPFALMCAGAETTTEFEGTFPLAQAGYVIEPGLGNLDGVLEELIVSDSRASLRQRMREHYLGPFPPETYSQGFIRAARNVIDEAAASMRLHTADRDHPTNGPSQQPPAPVPPTRDVPPEQ